MLERLNRSLHSILKKTRLRTAILVLCLTFVAFCSSQLLSLTRATPVPHVHGEANPPIQLADNSHKQSINDSYHDADASFTLRTDIGKGKLLFVGEGGNTDGQANPDLIVNVGEVVQIKLIDGDGGEHDITLPDLKIQSSRVQGKGATSIITLRADKEGTFTYLCSIPGHKEAGMIGRLIVRNPKASQDSTEKEAADIIQLPTAIPEPIGKRGTQVVRVNLEAVEVKGQLAKGTT